MHSVFLVAVEFVIFFDSQAELQWYLTQFRPSHQSPVDGGWLHFILCLLCSHRLRIMHLKALSIHPNVTLRINI